VSKYIWDEKNRYDLATIPDENVKEGGQGNVYLLGNQLCIKVLKEPDDFTIQLTIIGKILNHPTKPYEHVKAVGTVPKGLIWDENKKIVGYTMEQLLGWHGLHEIITEADSETLGVDLKSSGLILAALSRATRLIHSQGFVIGDFNPSNILFKEERGQFLVKFIDTDSWSIYRHDLDIEYASKVLDIGTIYYPDVIQANKDGKPWPNFTPNHDWWAFVYISWMILTKFDPYQTGAVGDIDKEERILENHTANRAATVRLHPEFGPATQALGPKLRFYLDRCLKRKVRRPFPTKVLQDFANNLRLCPCGFEAHASAVLCPSCAQLL